MNINNPFLIISTPNKYCSLRINTNFKLISIKLVDPFNLLPIYLFAHLILDPLYKTAILGVWVPLQLIFATSEGRPPPISRPSKQSLFETRRPLKIPKTYIFKIIY